MIETTDFTPEELAAALTVATALAEAAAEDANRERVAALVHAGGAADAKRRGAQVEAADHASAADNAAAQGRRAAATAVDQEERAWHLQRALDPEYGNDPAADEHPYEPTPADRALVAATEAEQAAREACSGVDWLRYHLDGHCRHWRERLSDGAASSAA